MHEKLLFTLPLSIIIFTYTITILYLCLFCAGLLNLVYSVCSGVSILLLDKENVEVKNSE